MNLTARAHLTERREGDGQLERRKPKGKTYFRKHAINTRSAGPKAKKRISELKIGFLNLPMLWKFAQGDLGGILT
jgi:hypothetical protein